MAKQSQWWLKVYLKSYVPFAWCHPAILALSPWNQVATVRIFQRVHHAAVEPSISGTCPVVPHALSTQSPGHSNTQNTIQKNTKDTAYNIALQCETSLHSAGTTVVEARDRPTHVPSLGRSCRNLDSDRWSLLSGIIASWLEQWKHTPKHYKPKTDSMYVCR